MRAFAGSVGWARSRRLRPALHSHHATATATNIKGESSRVSLLPLALSTWSLNHGYVYSCGYHGYLRFGFGLNWIGG
jgi:hypothetical protein